MTELTEVVLRMRQRIDIFPGPLARFFYEVRGHHISYNEIVYYFRHKALKELYQIAPDITVHPVCHAYPTWRRAKFAMSPADIEKAIQDEDPATYGVARSWLPCFEQTTGLVFPPNGKNSFLYRVYLSWGQKCAEGRETKNVHKALQAYGNKIMRKDGTQNVIKGGINSVIDNFDKVEKLPPKAQDQLDEFKKEFIESWHKNFYDPDKNGHKPPPKSGNKPVRCPWCHYFLTSGPGTPCTRKKCGWKPS
jgi:hypothetical protein